MVTGHENKDLSERIDREYSFGPVSDEQRQAMEMIRDEFRFLAHTVAQTAPNNRARSIALTELQNAKFWSVQAVVDGPPGQ